MSTRLELLKRYLQEDPDDSFIRYAIAMEHIAVDKHSEAYEMLLQLIIDDPTYLAAYYMAGKSAEILKLSDKALEFYSAGIKIAKEQKDSHTQSELQSAIDNLE